MNFAVIETGGKQYKVSAGQKIRVEKLAGEAGQFVALEKVLLTADSRGHDADKRGNGGNVQIGMPYIAGAKVEAKILRQMRDEKKLIFRFHAKTRYRKKKGHRQHVTELQIVKI